MGVGSFFRNWLFVPFLASLALLPPVVAAEPLNSEKLDGQNVVVITTADGHGADAMIVSSNKQRNFGNEPVLAVKSIDYSTKRSLLRFDLTKLPKDAQIEEAQLVLFTFNNHSQHQTIEVFGFTGEDDWVEGSGGEELTLEQGVTHENFAPAISQLGGVGSPGDLLGSFETHRKGGLSGDCFVFSSPELADFLNSRKSGTATLILTAVDRQNSQDVGFASKENPKWPPPELRIKLK